MAEAMSTTSLRAGSGATSKVVFTAYRGERSMHGENLKYRSWFVLTGAMYLPEKLGRRGGFVFRMLELDYYHSFAPAGSHNTRR